MDYATKRLCEQAVDLVEQLVALVKELNDDIDVKDERVGRLESDLADANDEIARLISVHG